MGRLPKIRVNYQGDAIYLTNLSRAIEMDDKRSPEWKRQALEHLAKVISLFMQDTADQLQKCASSKP